jgi:hypothetical protein
VRKARTPCCDLVDVTSENQDLEDQRSHGQEVHPFRHLKARNREEGEDREIRVRHFGSRGSKFLDIATAEIMIGKIPKGKRRVSVDCFGVQGFERPTPDHWIREVAKSDLLSAKRGSCESLLWVQISR